MLTNALRWKPHYLKPLVLTGLTIVAYFGAINRGQALPWAIASILLATLLTGYIWPHWLVKTLSVTRSGPQRAEEGGVVVFQITVNNAGWLPRFMVEVVDHLPFVGVAQSQDVSGEKLLGVVAYIGANSSRSFEVSVPCEKRGFYQLGPVGLSSSFPLGLSSAHQSRNEGVQTLTIYPDIFPIASMPLSGAPSEIHRGGFLLPDGAGAAEFAGMREYRRGDNPRHIHWPTTARMNELIVKEFEPLASASLYITLDMSADACVGTGKNSTFEYAVKIAASIARYASNSNMPIRLRGEGQQIVSIESGSGESHFSAILDVLAVVDTGGFMPYAKVLHNVASNCRAGQTVVVFLSESEKYIADTIEAISMLRARGANVYAIVFDRQSFKVPESAREKQNDTQWFGLLDLGVGFLNIRNGDNLLRVFNA